MQANTQNLGNKAKLRNKIDAKCRECIEDPYAQGTWRKQVENCPCYNCPLYPVRPITIGGTRGS